MGNVNICGGQRGGEGLKEITISKTEKKAETYAEESNGDLKGKKARANYLNWASERNQELRRELEAKIGNIGEKVDEAILEGLITERVSSYQSENPLSFDEDFEKYQISQNLPGLEPIRLGNGDVYQGQWNKEQRQEGIGLLAKADGEILEGVWKNGDLVKGRIFWTNGSIYLGEISQELPNGQGVWRENDWIYSGEFQNGVKQGKGKMSFNDGTSVEGVFRDDNPISGKFVWPDGSTYEGEINLFTLGPKGTFYAPSGNSYQGCWLDNKFDGEGTFNWVNNGQQYQGQYKRDRKEGNGVYYFAPERFYSGSWLHDKPHGHGELQTEDKIIKGLWRYGKLVQILSEATKVENVENVDENNLNQNINIHKEAFNPFNLIIFKEDFDSKLLSHLYRPESQTNQSHHSPTHKFKPVNVDKDLFYVTLKTDENGKADLIKEIAAGFNNELEGLKKTSNDFIKVIEPSSLTPKIIDNYNQNIILSDEVVQGKEEANNVVNNLNQNIEIAKEGISENVDKIEKILGNNVHDQAVNKITHIYDKNPLNIQTAISDQVQTKINLNDGENKEIIEKVVPLNDLNQEINQFNQNFQVPKIPIEIAPNDQIIRELNNLIDPTISGEESRAQIKAQ